MRRRKQGWVLTRFDALINPVPFEIEGLKKIVRDSLLEMGSLKTISTILRKFDYNNGLKLRDDALLNFKQTPDLSVELTNMVVDHLKAYFKLFHADKVLAVVPSLFAHGASRCGNHTNHCGSTIKCTIRGDSVSISSSELDDVQNYEVRSFVLAKPMFAPFEPDQMDVENCWVTRRGLLGFNKRSSQRNPKVIPLKKSTPQVDLNQESKELVVERTCDDVIEHHTDVFHDDINAFGDFKNIVPLTNIWRRLKGKKSLVEKPSKKPKMRDDDVSHCPVATKETTIPVAIDSDSIDSESKDDDIFQVFANIYASSVPTPSQ
ncbi:hypothetical protein Sjap_023653 [Stephania japonica]|uniref:EF hand associated type-2 domain-containing protein n=1 Tax=Stephania japonica TaxID=461633 RepID=A0AAP0EBZ6_9MAGN